MRITRTLPIPLVLLFVLVYLISHDILFRRAQAKGNTAAVSQADPIAPLSREMDFAYYSLREGFDSTLLLVSHSPDSIPLTIAIHNLMGETVSSEINIQAGAKLAVNLRSLLTPLGADAGGTFAEGSVAVSYRGVVRAVVGQVTITNPARSLVHESEMVQNDAGVSEVPPLLNSLWWGLTPGRDARIMVSNTTGSSIVADVFLEFDGENHRSTPLMFIPHETKVLSISELLRTLHFTPSQAPKGGITIISRGANPALIAQGDVMDPVTGFFNHTSLPGSPKAPLEPPSRQRRTDRQAGERLSLLGRGNFRPTRDRAEPAGFTTERDPHGGILPRGRHGADGAPALHG